MRDSRTPLLTSIVFLPSTTNSQDMPYLSALAATSSTSCHRRRGPTARQRRSILTYLASDSIFLVYSQLIEKLIGTYSIAVAYHFTSPPITGCSTLALGIIGPLRLYIHWTGVPTFLYSADHHCTLSIVYCGSADQAQSFSSGYLLFLQGNACVRSMIYRASSLWTVIIY